MKFDYWANKSVIDIGITGVSPANHCKYRVNEGKTATAMIGTNLTQYFGVPDLTILLLPDPLGKLPR